jgi:hypothetical protein
MQMHELGECPENYYGADCDGVGHWVIDPYIAEIHNEEEWKWMCAGVYYGATQDI